MSIFISLLACPGPICENTCTEDPEPSADAGPRFRKADGLPGELGLYECEEHGQVRYMTKDQLETELQMSVAEDEAGSASASSKPGNGSPPESASRPPPEVPKKAAKEEYCYTPGCGTVDVGGWLRNVVLGAGEGTYETGKETVQDLARLQDRFDKAIKLALEDPAAALEDLSDLLSNFDKNIVRAIESGAAGAAEDMETYLAARERGDIRTQARVIAKYASRAVIEIGANAATDGMFAEARIATAIERRVVRVEAGAAAGVKATTLEARVAEKAMPNPDVHEWRLGSPMRSPPGGGPRGTMSATGRTFTSHGPHPEPEVLPLPRRSEPLPGAISSASPDTPAPVDYLHRKRPDKATQEAVINDAGHTSDGRLRDANSGRGLEEGQIHFGHRPEYAFAKMREWAQKEGWTQEQLDDFYRDPNKWQIEYGPTNSSRQYDKLPRPEGQDRARVNVSQWHELSYWAERFGVSPEKVEEAVSKVGATVDKIERYLRDN